MAMSLATWKGKFDQRRIDAMAEELCRQAANIAAAEYRWLRLLADFDEVGGWAMGGAKSCAAWLSWACGISLPAARERVRVARALGGLPRLCEAMEAGRVSYSKARAVTRVATPANEELLVGYAQSATAAQLEKVLRGYRQASRLEDARDAAALFERRWVRHWVDENGCVRISACLPPDDGAVVVAQLERMAESGGEDDPAPATPEETNVSAETAESGRGDAAVVLRRWEAATPAEARRADALRRMAETCAATGPRAAMGGETHLVVVHARTDELRMDDDAATAAPPDPATDIASTIEGVGCVSAETARRLACDATITALLEDAAGRPLGIGRQTAKVPRRLRRALLRRDGGGCRFPGCTATRYVDAHHIRHWADGGATDLDNLILLCRFHHRLVHEVGYSILVQDDDFAFLRPDGSRVPDQPPSRPGDPATVERDNADRGLTIDWLTAIPDWDGTPPDYSAAIDDLCRVSAEALEVPAT